MAQVARTTLPELIKSREMARAAGATKINDYARAEDDFLILTKAIEDNNLRLAQRERGRVSKDFRALELRAIKDQTIGEVRKLLAQAENDGARKYAPNSLSMAQQKLKNTDTFITQNPYEKEKMQTMANDALFYAQRLIQMNKQSQKIRIMESEDMPYGTTVLAGALDLGDAGIKAVGVLWLLGGLGFAVASWGLGTAQPWGPWFVLVMTLASLVLSVVGWPDSRIGLVINLVLLATIFVAARVSWLAFLVP